MDSDKEFIPAPLPHDCVPFEICDSCAAGSVFHDPTQTAIAFCEHTKTGAILPVGGVWKTVCDIESQRFRDCVIRALTKAELVGDVARAMSESLLVESRASTKH